MFYALLKFIRIGGLMETMKTIKAIVKIIQDIKNPSLYSSRWFEQASDKLLKTEREKVRIDYCCSGDNFSKACDLERLLNRFDRELSKRSWAGRVPKAPSVNREHGWYLPNRD